MGELPQIPHVGQMWEEEMVKQLQDVLFCPKGGKKKSLGIFAFPHFDAQMGNRNWWLLEGQEAPTNYQKQVHINGLFPSFLMGFGH